MGIPWNLGAIVDAFTDAAVDPQRWDAAMEVVCRETSSTAAAIFPGQGALPKIPHSDSLRPSMDAYIRDGWVHRDERYKATPVLARQGVVSEFDFITPDEIARHPYYQEFLAPFGLRWFAGVKISCGQDFWVLSVQNSIEKGPFSPQELKMFADLSARLSGPAGLAWTVGFAKADAALEAFQKSSTAAVLINRFGRMFRANNAAEQLFGGDGLQLRNGQIASFDPNANSALHRAVQQVLWTDGHGEAGPIALPRRSGRPVLAFPMRLAALALDVLTPASGVIVLIDLDRPDAPQDEVLRSVFGSSPAEARLARLVAAGESLEQSALRLGIAYETARNQLKSVFGKTGTHRQGELAALIGRLRAPHSSR